AAPEQARGMRDVDARADLFALGCVLFRALAGRPPFEGEDIVAVLAKTLFEQPPLLRSCRPDAPAWLETLVADLMAKDPSERPGQASDVHESLVSSGMTGAPSKRNAGARVLTSDEQRVVSVLVVAPAAAHATTPGPSTDETLRD